MILPPLNDRECLDLGHAEAQRRAQHPVYIELAHVFNSPEEIAAFYRTRPLELDHGDPDDGPRIACIPSQRLRFLPDGKNCFEATFTYIPLAEIIDPSTPRTSCTVRIGTGYHTFPVENGRPVILDPEAPPRNAFDAGVYTCQRRNGLRPPIVHARQTRPWLVRVAANAARTPSERAAVRTAVRAINRSIYHGQPLTDLHAVATTIALAETEAPLWGEEGRKAVQHATQSIRALQQNIDLGKYTGLARRIGEKALEGYILAQTGPLGLVLLDELKGQRPPTPPTPPAQLPQLGQLAQPGQPTPTAPSGQLGQPSPTTQPGQLAQATAAAQPGQVAQPSQLAALAQPGAPPGQLGQPSPTTQPGQLGQATAAAQLAQPGQLGQLGQLAPDEPDDIPTATADDSLFAMTL